MKNFECEFCSDKAAKVSVEEPTKCRMKYCSKCKADTWHAPIEVEE